MLYIRFVLFFYVTFFVTPRALSYSSLLTERYSSNKVEFATRALILYLCY